MRPTSEEVRDRLVSHLESSLRGARVLDLFAGSGALGLEAMSRGAESADFVENGPASLHALKANVTALGVRKRCRVFKRDAIPFVDALREASYDVAFADPPYHSAKLDRVLAAWRAHRFAAILALEHAADQEMPAGGETLVFGETRVTIFRDRHRKKGRTR